MKEHFTTGAERFQSFQEFLRTIPFYLQYNHLSFGTDEGKLIISISSKRCKIYKLIKNWIETCPE